LTESNPSKNREARNHTKTNQKQPPTTGNHPGHWHQKNKVAQKRS